jgi:hypothetical protein
MNIQNIRFGHACNSSSTHSIIFYPEGHNEKDQLGGTEGNHYEWNDFVLTSKEAKLGYIGVLLKDAVARKKLPTYIWEYYVKDWLDCVPIDMENGGIDHASHILIPRQAATNMPDKEFFEEFKRHILDDKIVIYGGNDNKGEDDSYCGPSGNFRKSHVHCLRGRSYEYVRKDPVYGYWTQFNRRSGCKLRMAFDDRKITCASLPELVDLKITNRCKKKCSYCYQDSHKDGKHAHLYDIERIIEALSHLGVFEIALGGGETTSHPDFIKILEACTGHGIVPNFTTRDIDWFKNEKNVDAFKKHCGRVAFSVETEHGFEHVMSVVNYHHLNNDCRVAIQCIDGVSDLEFVLKSSKLPVVLLGYKETGRGAKSYVRNSIPTTFEQAYEAYQSSKVWNGLGIDTKYIADHREEIEKAGVHKNLYTTREGVYSMYIDAVKSQMGESSYCGKMVDLIYPSFGHKSQSLEDQIAKFFRKTSKRISTEGVLPGINSLGDTSRDG